MKTGYFYLGKTVRSEQSTEKWQRFTRIFTSWLYLLKGKEHEHLFCSESQGENNLEKTDCRPHNQKNQGVNDSEGLSWLAIALGLGCYIITQKISLLQYYTITSGR